MHNCRPGASRQLVASYCSQPAVRHYCRILREAWDPANPCLRSPCQLISIYLFGDELLLAAPVISSFTHLNTSTNNIWVAHCHVGSRQCAAISSWTAIHVRRLCGIHLLHCFKEVRLTAIALLVVSEISEPWE